MECEVSEKISKIDLIESINGLEIVTVHTVPKSFI